MLSVISYSRFMMVVMVSVSCTVSTICYYVGCCRLRLVVMIVWLVVFCRFVDDGVVVVWVVFVYVGGSLV